jgi:hypothetical protein
VVRLCEHHAAVWDRLHQWLVSGDGADGGTGDRFREQLLALAKLLGEAYAEPVERSGMR